MHNLFFITSFALFQFFSSGLYAGTILVKADGTGDQPDIQAAIMAASLGDSICLVDTLYSGPGNRFISFQGKAITVTSRSGDPDSCVLDFISGSPGDPGFIFSSGEDNNSVLSGVTLTNSGTEDSGLNGGIFCENSSPKITNCVIIGLTFVAGIKCINSSPIISNTTVSFNNYYSPDSPGGICLSSGSSPSITDCVIDNNFGSDCGKSSSICRGGGILCEDGSNPILTRCRISNNSTTDASGAGIALFNSSPTMVDCLVFNNQIFRASSDPHQYGGGLDCFNSSPVLVRCLFYGNGSGPGGENATSGGAISCRAGSSVVLEYCTVVGNNAELNSGGIFVQGGSLSATNSIIAFNDFEGILADSLGSISLSCCNIFGNTGGDWTGSISDQLGESGNFSSDPIFCEFESFNLTLSADSPCLPENNPTGISCQIIGALGLGCFLDEPHIQNIIDVPNDQGGQVRLVWSRSQYDSLGSPHPITGYGIYRYQGEPQTAVIQQQSPDKLLFWDFIATIPARGDTSYQFVAPTLCNSTISLGPCLSTFLISAMTSDPLTFFDSQPYSGFSLDNLAPSPPTSAVLHGDLTISWDDPVDPDFQYVTIYGSSTGTLDGSEVAIDHSTGTDFDARGTAHSYYLLTATDFSGNEGQAVVLENYVSGISEVVPNRTTLIGNHPNPFNPATVISFDLAANLSVRLQVFDLAGRLVRRIASGTVFKAGRNEVHWDGRDDQGQQAPAGIYFYRLEAGKYSETMRMMLLK